MGRSAEPSRTARKVAEAAPAVELEALALPDDQGLALDELSQAYAALVGKGADPYPETALEAEEHLATPAAAELEVEPPPSHGDDEACGITPRSILEAILFVGHPSGEPLTSERIAALMRGVRPSEIDDGVVELNDEYAAAGAPYLIESVGDGYRFVLRPEFAGLREVFLGRIREVRLSQAAIDVLAVVAYHQPIGLEEIDRLRGKSSAATLTQLIRRDLVNLVSTKDGDKKPKYQTTSRFLDVFGLERLGDLPQSEG